MRSINIPTPLSNNILRCDKFRCSDFDLDKRCLQKNLPLCRINKQHEKNQLGSSKQWLKKKNYH